MKALLNSSTEQRKWADSDFVKNYSSWTDTLWDEQDWSKVTEMSTREIITERQKVAAICQNAKCLDCPDFLKHVSPLPSFITSC